MMRERRIPRASAARRNSLRRSLLPLLCGGIVVLLLAAPALAAEKDDLLGKYLSGDPDTLTVSLKFLALLTILSIAPAILLLTTAFPRIVIVLGFVRRALSTQEVPPNQVVVGLALILTFMVMAPTWIAIKDKAIVPYTDHRISDGEALDIAVGELRQFMYPHIARSDLRLMLSLSRSAKNAQQTPSDGGYDGNGGPDDVVLSDVPTLTLIPAFLMSELKRAFEMGFLIYLPFVVIDLVVSSTLISMGMLVLPPVLISLPLKILVFVLVNGWSLVVGQLVLSFRTV